VEIAKALVLAGNTDDDQPWPSVRSGPKHLVPVANRPILFHNLEALRRAGLLEATIALDDENARATVAAVGDGSRWGLTVRYVPWRSGTGMAGALATALEFIADEPIMVQPADALHRDHIHPHIAAFARDRLDAVALTITAAGGGSPAVGGYLFSRRAVSVLLDAPDADSDPLVGVRDVGGQVRVQPVDSCLPCHGGQDRLLDGNRWVLEQLKAEADASAYPGCEIQGPVLVHPTATLKRTLVRGPAVIGAQTVLSDAYVGPYTSIGDGVRIDGSQIEHSIVLDGARLMHVGVRLDSSVIGRGARVGRAFGPTTAMQLSVGDGAEVTLS
jgi:glucose-1-phosphate thymidylyltransferase